MLYAMGRDEMRAADGDRERVAGMLRRALDEGRLDLHEYDKRLQHAYAAKTYGELDRLLADLPTVVPEQRSGLAPSTGSLPAATAAPGHHPDVTRRWLIATWDDYAGVVALTVGIWIAIYLFEEKLEYFWPAWVAGPWGAYLLWETIRGLSTGEPQRWAAEQDTRHAAKLAKEQARRDRRALRRGEPRADTDRSSVG